MDIQNFIAEFKKTFIYDMLCESLEDEQLFEHTIIGNQVIWMKEQTRQMWAIWQAAKANAVPEPSQEKTWDEIHLDPKERLYWSLRSSKKRKSDLNWHHASHQTCVGSTHGRKICEYLGVNPDSKDFMAIRNNVWI